jgi:signal transduction histidine kinase
MSEDIRKLDALPDAAENKDDFNRMRKRLRELDEMKKDFISYVSHTLRTPLTAMKEASRMLMDGTYAAVPAKKKELLELKPSCNLPSVKMDEERIAQVMENLIGNALKFSAVGGKVVIEATMKNKRRHWIEVCVADRGRGIPHENLGSIFDRFQRIDGGRKKTQCHPPGRRTRGKKWKKFWWLMTIPAFLRLSACGWKPRVIRLSPPLMPKRPSTWQPEICLIWRCSI